MRHSWLNDRSRIWVESVKLNIVIPMAGRGSRFAVAGYTTPKPFIPIHGVPMIQAVIRNITPSYQCRHIFLVLNDHISQYQMDHQLRLLVPDCVIVPVSHVTEGAACTVLLARGHIDNDTPLMIANSDQYVDIDINDYLAQQEDEELDGLIMTFWSDHPKWSYCRLSETDLVTEVVEKKVVSNEATVGIYNFRRGSDFVAAADEMISQEKRANGEFYVAPAYNEMIARHSRIGVYNIGREYEQMHGLGVPEDLKLFESKSEYKSRIAVAALPTM